MRRFSMLILLMILTPIAVAGCGQQQTAGASWIWTAAVAVGTIALAVVAAFSEEIKKTLNRTKLRFEFTQGDPDCQEITINKPGPTGQIIAQANSYYVRFRVYNNGRNTAENVEVFLSDVFRIKNGKPVVHQRYIPLDLVWANKTPLESHHLTSINREFYGLCDIGYVVDPAARRNVGIDPFPAQQAERKLPSNDRKAYSRELLEELDKEVAFTLDTIVKPNNGSHFLFKGEYILRLRIAGSNVKPQYCYFRIDLRDSNPNYKRYEKTWDYYILVEHLRDTDAERIIRKPKASIYDKSKT